MPTFAHMPIFSDFRMLLTPWMTFLVRTRRYRAKTDGPTTRTRTPGPVFEPDEIALTRRHRLER
jgi:hypothetical protein